MLMLYLYGMKLLEDYLSRFHSSYTIFEKSTAGSLYKKRDPLAHKGSFGHSLILAGSYGKIGAAILAARGCLAAGSGLLTIHLPACGYEIMQATVPEAMVQIDDDQFHLTSFPENTETYQSAGFGPGIGIHADTAVMIKNFIRAFRKPLVLDADALNLISKRPKLLSALYPGTIITPHPKEFDRLFGECKDETSRLEKAAKMAVQYNIVIVLKGHFTGVFTPDEKISFNTSGNPGMAKGGSGDVLTGIITALLAQSYPPETAARLGVYLHGLAGDIAASTCSEEAMLPSDLIRCIGRAFLEFKNLS
jgi:NAD(P)H-hydrate epimerase